MGSRGSGRSGLRPGRSGTRQLSVEAGGAIYKIDGVTGAPSLFAKLPQQLNQVFHDNGEYFYANGLGQIGYDGVHDQLFVSNREDGTIYRLSMAEATPPPSTRWHRTLGPTLRRPTRNLSGRWRSTPTARGSTTRSTALTSARWG
ncbi:MAG: hypothetical protein R3F11_30105 [Verrucomicrobiales bacterium]